MKALASSARCESTTPLGDPVVPLVYWITAGDAGDGEGSTTLRAGQRFGLVRAPKCSSGVPWERSVGT